MVTPQLIMSHLQIPSVLWLPKPVKKYNLFLLDRNAVSLIFESSYSQIEKETPKYQHIKQLQNLDECNNIISLFLSTLEGINPKKETTTPNHRIRRLSDEIEAVKKFYKKAKTDANFLSPIASTLSI